VKLVPETLLRIQEKQLASVSKYLKTGLGNTISLRTSDEADQMCTSHKALEVCKTHKALQVWSISEEAFSFCSVLFPS
jgi:hypothetical protein